MTGGNSKDTDMIRQLLIALLLVCPTASVLQAGEPAGSTKRIKAFCIDFNWGPGGPNTFAAPGVYTQASPEKHVKWYRDLGANTIQTFCVSCCGYAWFRSDVAPVQPGMKGDFLKEVTHLGHKHGMKALELLKVECVLWRFGVSWLDALRQKVLCCDVLNVLSRSLLFHRPPHRLIE